MSGPKPGAAHDELVRDWVTIWQSELAAIATDREAATQSAAWLGNWLALGEAWRECLLPGADAAAGTPPADAASGPGRAGGTARREERGD